MPQIIVLALAMLFWVSPAWGYESALTQIVFQAYDDGDADIYVMDDQVISVRNLTQNTFTDVNPAWSPDGQQIVFISNRDDTEEDIYFDYAIYTMDIEGQNVQQLVDNVNYEVAPSWSPDGAFIAYVASEGDDLRCVLNIMKPDGRERRALFSTESCRSFAAHWSPDSTRLLLESDGQIYSVRLADASVLQLTLGEGIHYAPVWSPDGSKIAYVVEADRVDNVPRYQIFIMNADGNGVRQVTSAALSSVGPRFTADGAALVYGAGDEQQTELYLQSLDESQPTPLTRTLFQKFSWALSPDGTRLIYVEIPETDVDFVYIVDLSTGAARQLMGHAFRDAARFAWQPSD